VQDFAAPGGFERFFDGLPLGCQSGFGPYRLCLDKGVFVGLNSSSDWTVNSFHGWRAVTWKVMPEIAPDFPGRVAMVSVFLQPGRAYSFCYPRHNYRRLPTTTELRRIEVVSIRDTHRSPLDPTTRPLNPLLKRGRWLVTGKDLEKDAERSFYFESMTNIQLLSEEDLEPLKDIEFVVIEQTRVAFRAQRLIEALAFRAGRPRGTICGVLYQRPRALPPISILDEPIPDIVDEREV
jgi:hypothetical protein